MDRQEELYPAVVGIYLEAGLFERIQLLLLSGSTFKLS